MDAKKTWSAGKTSIQAFQHRLSSTDSEKTTSTRKFSTAAEHSAARATSAAFATEKQKS